MSDKNNTTETKQNARTAKRHDFQVPRSIVYDIGCAILAIITTVLIWLSGAL